jgi:hypothetical protein
MSTYTGKLIKEIVNDIQNYDTGYCNPIKLKHYEEDFREACHELEERGYSRVEAERILKDE